MGFSLVFLMILFSCCFQFHFMLAYKAYSDQRSCCLFVTVCALVYSVPCLLGGAIGAVVRYHGEIQRWDTCYNQYLHRIFEKLPTRTLSLYWHCEIGYTFISSGHMFSNNIICVATEKHLNTFHLRKTKKFTDKICVGSHPHSFFYQGQSQKLNIIMFLKYIFSQTNYYIFVISPINLSTICSKL